LVQGFLNFCWKPKGFFWVLILLPFDHAQHLKSGTPLPHWGLKDSRNANDAWSHDQVIDFENASVIDKGNPSLQKGFGIVADHDNSQSGQ